MLRALRDGYLQEIERSTETNRRCSMHNAKHDFYKHTRVTNLGQEESGWTQQGVMNVYENSSDDEDYFGEQKEVQAEIDALKSAHHWINPAHWAAEKESLAQNHLGQEVDLRIPRGRNGHPISWETVKKMLGDESNLRESCPEAQDSQRKYDLGKLDPTQRAFADRVLGWGAEVCGCYKDVEKDGVPRNLPILRMWLCGSAGSGKSTTLKTIVFHFRAVFSEANVPCKIELTAYTGVAAFNIGFGARTTCSAFQIFPNAAWTAELSGKKEKLLEQQWANVELLIVDEISFIGRALFARMHYRLQQGRRSYFANTAKDRQFCQRSPVLPIRKHIHYLGRGIWAARADRRF